MKKTIGVKKKNSQRLQILGQDEVAELYAVPQFNPTDRSHYFLLPDKVLHSLKIMKTNGRNTSARLWFILQYGYFKARHQFFNISYGDAREDVRFIMAHYLTNDCVPDQLPSRRIQGVLKSQILQWMGYRDNINTAGQFVAEKAGYFAKITHSVTEIFGETIHYLESKKMVLPAYSKLQDMIGTALKAEECRLIEMMKQHLTKRARQSLKTLFSQDDGLYRVTELKLDAKNFQTKEMACELDKLTLCRPIYAFAKKILPKLGLSRSMIEHYSDLAKLYRVARLRRILEELSFLYLVCYVHGRYERLASNLIQGFLYYVDKYHSESKNYAKAELVTLASPLEQHHKSIGKLMEIFTDKKIQIQSGNVIRKRAFNVMPEKNIAAISSKLLHGEDDRKKQEQRLIWEYHRGNHQAILSNLRPLFMEIDFDGNDDLQTLFKAIRFLKSNFDQGVPLKAIPLHMIPTEHIKPKALLNLFTEASNTINTKSTPKKSIDPWQYEFYIYRAIRENIRASKVYVNSSVGYKSFEAEINVRPNWQKEEKKILKELNNPVLLRSIDETLTELENILEPLIERTNRRALSGENKHINITRHRDGRMTWTIPYPKQNIEIDNPFYDSLEIKTISEIYDFVAQECRFMKAFTPITQRGATKIKKDYLGIKATILANGTMQGTHEFSKRSNLKYQRLQTAEQGHIRLSTLRDAADMIANCMLKLPIFDLYDLGGKKHGSVDGTKKKTRRRILKARHSKKYFGTDIGLVIMTMLLGHVPFVTEIIGANEHESHFLFSMLSRNTSDIDPHIISSDTAGANNVNDLMYYLIGKIHAPCYRSAAKKTKNICGFKPLSHYDDLLIKPSSQANIKLIKDTWPELLPILVSLLSHDSKQENIIKALSSHDFRSDIKDAIWEFNNILKSIHHLKYVDDPGYRRYIRTALNRGEAYHQILEKIMAVGGSSFRGMSELEVEIWNECARLIALIIIYYNMHLLSKLYESALLRNDTAAIEFLRHISPVASQHININGLYEFSEIIENINVDGIVEKLNKILEEVVKASPA
jgi:TnpA family transposase